jgi:DedD protein
MMAQMDSNDTPQPEADDDETLRKRLLKRVSVAAALVVALLAGLALFDRFSAPPEQPAKPVAGVAPPVKPIDAPVAEEKPAEEKMVDKPDEKTDAPKEAAAEPERTAEPTGTMPPAHGERALTVPATARPAMLRPSEPVLAAPKQEPAGQLARVVPAPMPPGSKPAGGESRPAGLATRPAPAPASRPIARAAEAVGQFLLQMGVFNSVVNAEELRAKLELAGVPAQIEARVQVGPFATRQEAEQAREKLKSLGMDPGLVVAARK